MKMFATDLDRTIIFSKNAISDLNTNDNLSLLPVEKRNGEEIAFMSVRSYDFLHRIAPYVLFVPVTTRTTKQFNRVFIFHKDIPITYAVTYNGAEILYKGEPLVEWREQIETKIKNGCASLPELYENITKCLGNINGSLKKVESLFLYYILKEKLSEEWLLSASTMADELGWKISYQGRKLYFMPKPISKGTAINFIKKREGIRLLIGAGDSSLDEDFLKICDHIFVPAHGELAKSMNFRQQQYTKEVGVKAGEEILGNIHELLAVNL